MNTAPRKKTFTIDLSDLTWRIGQMLFPSPDFPPPDCVAIDECGDFVAGAEADIIEFAADEGYNYLVICRKGDRFDVVNIEAAKRWAMWMLGFFEECKRDPQQRFFTEYDCAEVVLVDGRTRTFLASTKATK